MRRAGYGWRDSLHLLSLLVLFMVATDGRGQVPAVAWQYRAEVTESALETFGPGAPIATLAAQLHQESAWRADAVSWAGARGLAQFMPATAADMAQRYAACQPANPFDPSWSIRCRDRYLHSLLRALRPLNHSTLDQCDQWAFALRAYNGGLGWINRDRRRSRAAGADADDWHVVALYNDGRRESAHRENREYPARIFALDARYALWGPRACPP